MPRSKRQASAKTEPFGAGTTTLSRQHLTGGRAEQPEEVRRLRPSYVVPPVPLSVVVRPDLPRDALLTLHIAPVLQGNEPQHQGAGDARQAARGQPAGAGSSPTMRRCRGKCGRAAAATLSRVRRACCACARVVPIGPDEPNFAWVGMHGMKG